MSVRIAQISDTHLSPSRPFFRDNFNRVAEHLTDDRPDLIINTGDLALDGADSAEDLVEAKTLHAALGIATMLLPGNHDIGDHPDVAKRQPVNAERLQRYRSIIGDDFWTFDLPGWRVVGLNALNVSTGLTGDEAQSDMLATAVAGLGGRSLAVFLHKPWCDQAQDEPLIGSRFMTPAPRQRLNQTLAQISPALVACGHVHQYRNSIIAGTRHIWSPATSFMISDPWQPVFGAKTVGYVEHNFHADGAHDHRLVPLRDLAHHDLKSFPEAYGDITQWGPGGA